MLKPEIPQQVSVKLKAGQQKQAEHYDKTAKLLPPLNSGDQVRVRLPGSTTWSLGVCKNQVAPRLYLVECNGTLYRRNRKHIRKENTSTSLGQYAIGWGDSNIDREEVEEREISEPSGAMSDRQCFS